MGILGLRGPLGLWSRRPRVGGPGLRSGSLVSAPWLGSTFVGLEGRRTSGWGSALRGLGSLHLWGHSGMWVLVGMESAPGFGVSGTPGLGSAFGGLGGPRAWI